MKKYVKLFIEALAAVLLLVVVCAINGVGSAFCDGKNHVYYFKASSQGGAAYSDEALPAEIIYAELGGESASFDGTTIEEIERKYSAVLLFEESASGVDNYYYYSPLFSRFAFIGGRAVNLHVAVRDNSVRVGTPIIFGGY